MKKRAGSPPWLWLNLLSLDAPLVAIVWQDFLARCYPYPLRQPARWVLGLTVWAIYLGDRLMDVRHPAAENETARHSFYRRHRAPANVLLAAVLIADIAIAVLWVRPAVFSNGLLVSAGVVCYLAIFALWPSGGEVWKQSSAAFLFTTGIFLVAWTQTPNAWPVLGWPAAVFCALCLGNLLLIEGWEDSWENGWEDGQSSARGWLWMLLLASGCLLRADLKWYAAVAGSAIGLALLDFRSRQLPEDARRVLADAVLLTPLLFR
jgi:hypothetical protein